MRSPGSWATTLNERTPSIGVDRRKPDVRMNRIDAVFEQANSDRQAAFVPFLVAGDPDLTRTFTAAREIEKVAAALRVPLILELGFPYSDPMADGPVIQAAYTRALDQGVRVAEILSAIKDHRSENNVPLVGMVSFAIVHRCGTLDFLQSAKSAGLDGLIIPDLPVEEAAAVLEWGRVHDFKIIQLIAPTTHAERMAAIARSATGFIYYISVAGITGERQTLPEGLAARLEELRRHARVPICVGFGVSSPEQVELLAKEADGIIVGSALVRRLAEIPPGEGLGAFVEFVRELVRPLARP